MNESKLPKREASGKLFSKNIRSFHFTITLLLHRCASFHTIVSTVCLLLSRSLHNVPATSSRMQPNSTSPWRRKSEETPTLPGTLFNRCLRFRQQASPDVQLTRCICCMLKSTVCQRRRADLLGLRDFCCQPAMKAVNSETHTHTHTHTHTQFLTHLHTPCILATTCPISANKGSHISVMMGVMC